MTTKEVHAELIQLVKETEDYTDVPPGMHDKTDLVLRNQKIIMLALAEIIKRSFTIT